MSNSAARRATLPPIAHFSPLMQTLPIDVLLPELVQRLSQRGALVLEAPPGAGKTTRVPLSLSEVAAIRGEILVSEPRRLAARMAAQRVANELGERVGERIGYRVRFEEAVGPRTRVVYATEGVLLRRLLQEPDLASVGAVVLDEFHERHLETDLLLAILAHLRATRRPDLKLVVMSATLDAEPVARFLDDAPRLSSEGRMFPIEIEHQAQASDLPLEKQVVSAVRQLLNQDRDGNVLVFLPGASEIRRAQESLDKLASEQRVLVVPLHGDLPIQEQARAIEPAAQRKVVLATNVAESSVTIDGVVGVVDSGLARSASHSPWSGLPTLALTKISRASAIQRAGRAGRTRPGRVLRLYTYGDFLARPEHDTPELLRADLTDALLTLHGSGIRSASSLNWLAPPPAVRLRAAEELLALLGATDADGALTAVGKRLLELPLHPRLARVLYEAEQRGVAETGALMAALLGERDIRSGVRTRLSGPNRPGAMDTATGPSDVLELVDVFELARSLSFDARRLHSHGIDARSTDAVARAERQLLRSARKHRPVPDDSETELLKCLLSGFADRVARRRKAGGHDLLLASGTTAKLSPDSVVRNEEFLLAIDVEERAGQKASEANVRLASAIRPEWLLDMYPERVAMTDEFVWNAGAERVDQVSRMSFGALTLDESRAAAKPSEGAAKVLCEALLGVGALEFLKSDALTTLSERVQLIATHFPNAGLTPLDEAGIREHLLALSADFTSFAELRALDLVSAFTHQFSPEARRLLDRETPLELRLPGGRNAKINYEPGKPPWLESRLQDFFGMAKGPTVCAGRIAITLHLLAPNARAVQVTSDLAGFWQRHYPSIRRELMRRYPRHSWPEDEIGRAHV